MLWRRSIVPLMLLLPGLLLASCCAKPRPCPVPVTPPPRVIVQPRPPCLLPSWPQPPTMGGVPEGETVVVTRDGIAELGRWAAGVKLWAATAAACLDVDGP